VFVKGGLRAILGGHQGGVKAMCERPGQGEAYAFRDALEGADIREGKETQKGAEKRNAIPP